MQSTCKFIRHIYTHVHAYYVHVHNYILLPCVLKSKYMYTYSIMLTVSLHTCVIHQNTHSLFSQQRGCQWLLLTSLPAALEIVSVVAPEMVQDDKKQKHLSFCSVATHPHMYMYTYICIHVHVYIHVCMYMYTSTDITN